jgi:hypothetical protein
MEDDKPCKRIVRDGFILDICLTSSSEGELGGSVEISNDEGKKCRVVLASAVNDEAAALRQLERTCLDWIASLAARDLSRSG